MISCIIIDDQIEAVEIIESHVKNKSELTLVKTFTNPLEALSFVEKNNIDLVFIDVQMPHLNGLDFIESLRAKKGSDIPKFVLTTGYDEYALSGFEQGAVDYLLKPVGFKRFNIAIDRIIANFPKTEKIEPLKIDFFFADANGQKIKIQYADIAYILADSNYITVYGKNLKAMIYKNLTSIKNVLKSDNFIRVHKSYIVSIKHINAIKGNELILNNDVANIAIPIGATYKENLLSVLKI